MITRKIWIDAAKGLCMILVVLRHSTLWIEDQFNEGPATFWWQVSEFLSPIRMPLFFLISGYLVANALRRPLSQSRARTYGMMYIYMFWTALFLLRLWIPSPGGGEHPSWGNFFLAVILPTSFWYLWALAFYFLLCWGFQRVLGKSAVWLAIPLFALAFFTPSLNDFFVPLIPQPLDALKVGSITQNFIWYFAGAFGRPVFDRMMESTSALKASGWGLFYVAAYAGAASFELQGVLHPLLSLIAIVAIAYLIPLIPLNGPISKLCSWIGRQTLPVYIFHIFGISAISLIVKAVGLDSLIINHMGIASSVIPPLLTVLLVSISMLMGTIILGSRARFLFNPAWLKARQ
ncbi:MAG: acyltransferase family protein [Ancrocorticia sp.]